MTPIYTRIYTQAVEFNRALGYAYDALVHGPYPFDALATWKGLSERVAQGIYMGQGLLLPHTRVPGLKGPLMAFVVCKDAFFNTSRGQIPLTWLGTSDALPLATRMETRLPWRPTRGSLTSPSYLVRNRTLGPPLENNPETPPSSRDEGLRLLHGLRTNLATSLQTPQEA